MAVGRASHGTASNDEVSPKGDRGKRMSDSITSQHPHLPSLSVAGFRGVEQLTIPRLGRVTLLAGRNGAGKTTVLDAVRIYAARGQLDALRELLIRRSAPIPNRKRRKPNV